MDYHYDSMNFGSDELGGGVPEITDPALLLVNPAEESYDVQEGGEAEAVSAEFIFGYTNTAPTTFSNEHYYTTSGSGLSSTVDYLPTFSDVSDWHQSNVLSGMSSFSASASTDLDASTRASVSNGADRGSFEHDLSSNTLMQGNIDGQKCPCVKCRIKTHAVAAHGPGEKYPCFFNCGFRAEILEETLLYAKYDLFIHYRETHFKQGERYHCPEPKCTRTFKRWSDLERHQQVHCLRPGKYPCDVLGCKYGGKNGFGRHDKLLSHKRNVHEGKATPGQLMRRRKLLPKA